MLGEDLVEDVVDGEREAGLILQQLLHQQRVQVVRVHHVVPEIIMLKRIMLNNRNATCIKCLAFSAPQYLFSSPGLSK